MKSRTVYISLAVLYLLVLISSISVKAAPIMRLAPSSKLKVIKAKSYQHDTIAIIWYDSNGDDICDAAELYEKKDGFFIAIPRQCKQADEINMYILEPKI